MVGDCRYVSDLITQLVPFPRREVLLSPVSTRREQRLDLGEGETSPLAHGHYAQGVEHLDHALAAQSVAVGAGSDHYATKKEVAA